MQQLNKLYQGILWGVVLFLCLLAICNVAPRLFGIQPYIVLSGSMEPTLPTGSIVYIDKNISPEDIHVGDIISYHQGPMMITHRVIEESSSSVITKGDANEQADFAPISRDVISGRYTFHIPVLGYIYAQLTQPVFYLIMIGFFSLQLILSYFISKLSNNQSTRKESYL